ncbi:hypothetical protein [Kitasatospora sp. NPDC090091]|uniref:hypothetical protein n=1 Tax=Kitasatospora sp. NPDC090091 TaxID=3364081 RepID=UPI00383047CA
MAEPFENRIESIIPATPGLVVHATVREYFHDTGEYVVRTDVCRLVSWALVSRQHADTEETKVEPVFLLDGMAVNASEHQRMYSELDRAPGSRIAKATVRVVTVPATQLLTAQSLLAGNLRGTHVVQHHAVNGGTALWARRCKCGAEWFGDGESVSMPEEHEACWKRPTVESA